MKRTRIELVTALVAGAAAIATFIWPTWIEGLTSLEPDQGSGESEWWIVAALVAVSVLALALSLRDYRIQRLARQS